jgi:hypothetical protein
MASIIFAAAISVYSTASYVLTYLGQHLPIDEAVEVCVAFTLSVTHYPQANCFRQSPTPNSSSNRNVQMSPLNQLFANAKQLEQDDMAYIPWPAPSSRVQVMSDMLSRDNFVVCHDEILYDIPLTFCHRKLPSPDEVRAASSLLPLGKPHVVPFPALGIIVKFGRRCQTGAASYTSLSEAQSLYTVRRFLGKHVPVPEVYAFVHDRDHIFLHMELVRGVTLLDCWDDLSGEARMDVCAQL